VNAFQLLPTCSNPAVSAFRSSRATAGGIVECATVLPAEGGTALVSHDAVEIDAERAVEPLRRESLVMHRIVLADDHPVVRQSIKRILNQQADFDLVGETDNGLETLGLVKQLQPDLLVTDLMMPGLNGLEVARRVRLSFPATRIVVVSVNADEPYVAGAFRCGANAFVLKTACGRHLIPAVRAVLAGHRYVSPPLSEPVL
jgi:CheY-like chemotaxis protein